MKRVLFVAVAVCCLGSVAWGQMSTGKIIGTIQDTSGGTLPGVTLVVRNLGTNITREAVTNERGQYEVPALPPGRYQIEGELTGFKRHSRGPITVQVNQETRVDFPMELGTLEETITVVAEGLVVQTTTSAVGRVVEQKQIVELPLSGRNSPIWGCSPPASRRAANRRQQARVRWYTDSVTTPTTSSWMALRTCRLAATR